MIKEKLVGYLNKMAEEKGISITEDGDLFETGVLDSLGIIRLLSFISDELGIALGIDDLDIECFKSINSLVALLER